MRCIWQVTPRCPQVPILGMGGSRTGRDAFELVLAGASAVSVGTAIFHDPSAPVRVLPELTTRSRTRGFATLADAGRPRPPRSDGDALRWPTSLIAPIAVALDTADLETAVALGGGGRAARQHASRSGSSCSCAHGADAVAQCREASGGRDVFLDLKLHDIPNTVAGAARSVAELAPDLLTVHASGGAEMVRAAVEAPPAHAGRGRHRPHVPDRGDLAAVGLTGPPRDVVRRLARARSRGGARALVCSPLEVADVRREVGPDVC